MADFSTKQFQELNEAYVSMYRTEEVVEETQEEVVEEVVEATQEEVIEEVEELDENAANRAKQRALRQAQNKDRAQKQVAAVVEPLKAKPTGGVGAERRRARGSQYRAPKADTPAPTPAPEPKADTPKPTPAPAAEPKVEVKTREIKKPSDGAERRTPTMAELRAAQSARAAGKSEKDVVKAGIAAGKPKVSARTLPTPPPPVKKKSRLDTALSGIGKFKEAYDVVLEYLLSGGHAETVEEAHYVMLEMDTETIKNICEEAQEG